MTSNIEPVKLEEMDGLGKFVFFEVAQGKEKRHFVRGNDVRAYDHAEIRSAFIEELSAIEDATMRTLGGGHYTHSRVLNTLILDGSSFTLGKVPALMHDKLCTLIHEKYPGMNILDNHLE